MPAVQMANTHPMFLMIEVFTFDLLNLCYVLVWRLMAHLSLDSV
jgi:hypothetical protein